jgi:agmatinase
MSSQTDTSISLPSNVDEMLVPYSGYDNPIEDPYETNFAEMVDVYPDADAVDVGMYGIPFDTAAVAGARGSRMGPNGVRDKMSYWTCYNPELDIDISEGLDVVDFGDVDVTQTDVLAAHEEVEIVSTALTERDVIPVAIGGDHSLTYPAAKGLMNATDGNIGVINLDAHHDVRYSHGGELSSGTPFRRLLEDDSGKLNHKNFVELGLSGWHNSKYYVDWVRENGGTVIPAREIHFESITDIAERALAAATDGTDAVYLSVDIDVLEPGDAPGTSVPAPGGLRSYELLELVYQIGRNDLVQGFDLMEVAPPIERFDRITAMVASSILHQYFGAVKERNED